MPLPWPMGVKAAERGGGWYHARPCNSCVLQWALAEVLCEGLGTVSQTRTRGACSLADRLRGERSQALQTSEVSHFFAPPNLC